MHSYDHRSSFIQSSHAFELTRSSVTHKRFIPNTDKTRADLRFLICHQSLLLVPVRLKSEQPEGLPIHVIIIQDRSSADQSPLSFCSNCVLASPVL